MPIYYERGEVTVDDNFARFANKAFAINKINSVEVRVEHKPASMAWIVIAIIGSLLGLSMMGDGSARAIMTGLVVLGITGAISYFAYKGSRPTDTYRLFLMTSSTEAQAYTTMDADDIRALRNAIESAIAASR